MPDEMSDFELNLRGHEKQAAEKAFSMKEEDLSAPRKDALMRAIDDKIKHHVLSDTPDWLRLQGQLRPSARELAGDFNAGAVAGVALAKAAAPVIGMKHDGGKPPVSLVPQALIYGAARAYGFGAQKYARYNYRLGIQASRLLDAAMRHLTEVAEGKKVDEESGLHPLDHAAAALGMLMDTLERVRQGKISEDFNDLYSDVT